MRCTGNRVVDDRRPRPEDRYALAGGCYTVEVPGEGHVARRDGALVLATDAAGALPLHFQATRLGEYLLVTNEGRAPLEGAWWDRRRYLAGDSSPLASGDVVVADEPSPDAEWRVAATGDDPDARAPGNQGIGLELSLPSRDEVLTARDGRLELAPAGSADAAVLSLRHVPDDDPADGDPNGTACATWPEIETNASGRPQPVADSEVDRARGFFEAHVHGMAFEFLGGELRCGRPWHPYGVEHALCQLFPVKRNSCNEMDGVRLQAQRLFELQDYIDAQSGGPGEGWFRIVTTPAQARQVINAGRLAVVLGIEVSVLFDCGEILDHPQCDADDIDERLQEVFDMGVRQMELVNKFDNALSGVTGDSGATGVVVNTGNRLVTGHWWDMRTCQDDHGHDHGLEGDEHDKEQLTPTAAAPEGIDALAGRILQEFGVATRGYIAPLYPRGPHCNSRGLTDLGVHLIRGMVEKGMIFDPDHMSALAQRQALALIEGDWQREQQDAAADDRPARRPAVVSSHSWANDVVYQWIYRVGGTVAPRTQHAEGFVDSWRKHAGFAAADLPEGDEFGLGYGADTNGLGGQPGPRHDPSNPLEYTDEGFEAPIGGVRLWQQRSGVKAFDVNEHGVAHYGLFADWYRELALAAGTDAPAILDDMLNAPEAFLQLWERGVYGGGSCVTDGSTLQPEDLHAALGLNLEGFLRAVGAPADRDGTAYHYCTEAEGGGVEVLEVVFDGAGVASAVAEPVTSVVFDTTAGLASVLGSR